MIAPPPRRETLADWKRLCRIAIEQRDALAASLAKYQECRVHDVDEKNWLRDKVQALEAELAIVKADRDSLLQLTATSLSDVAKRLIEVRTASETHPVQADGTECMQCKGSGWDSTQERECDCVAEPASETDGVENGK